MAFTWYVPFSVAPGGISAPLTNFPVLLRVVGDTRFKTIGNGGLAANGSGFDLRPYADSAHASPLTYTLVSYDGTAGSFEMWVKAPTLNNVTGVPVYLFLGDSGLTTDGSSTTTFDSTFVGVWPLPNGSSLSAVDISQGGHNGTVHVATAAAGKIDGGADFGAGGANGAYIDVTAISVLNSMASAASSMTVSGWVYRRSNASGGIFSARGGGGWVIAWNSSGNLMAFSSGSFGASTAVIPLNTWTFVTITYTSVGTVWSFSVNAGGVSTVTKAIDNGTLACSIGDWNLGAAGSAPNGILDDIRVSANLGSATAGIRSADWILAEYNQGSSPTAPGTEVVVIAPGDLIDGMLLDGYLIDSCLIQ